MSLSEKSISNWFVLGGFLSGIFYLLHVIFGQLMYPGYDWMKQAVSDLTAVRSPSREIASAFSFLYGLFSCLSCTVLCVLISGKFNRPFRVGIYLYTAMNVMSFVGYTLFPLSDSGYQGQFQDIIHLYVVTVGVVLLSIASLVMIGIGGFRKYGYRPLGIISTIVLSSMFIGSIGMGLVPKELFGLFERFSVFGVVVFTSALGLFGFSLKHTE